MVNFEERPTTQVNGTDPLAPPPARCETWHNLVSKGLGGGEHNLHEFS